ncbi:MAG: glycosyltransferase family 9 protein [Bacteroidales bacterium]|jgi:ADP-heptose:LPS heptosyltransferase|nr:glycosyltransferase family 9 protein [Bacteroidales bacterium]
MNILKLLILNILIVVHRFPLLCLLRKKPLSDSILILKIDAIGDSIIWLDSAKIYKEKFPNHHLILLHNKAWTDIAEKLPYFDKCIPFDSNLYFKSIFYRLKLLKNINQIYYQKVINPTFSRNFFIQDYLVRNIHAQEKIGSSGDYSNTNSTLRKLTTNFDKYNPKLKKIADKWYTQLIEKEGDTKMELLQNAEFVQNYFQTTFEAHLPSFPFEITHYQGVSFKKYAVFIPGSSTLRRSWDIQKMATVARYVIENEQLNIVVCGSQSESILFDKLLDYLPQKESFMLNLCGKTTLLEMISVLKEARLIIGNETAASHIAVAVRTPSICLLGGGHFGRFQPYPPQIASPEEQSILPKIVFKKMDCFGCGWICPFPLENGKWKCIHLIETEDVIKQIEHLNK